MGKWKQAGLVCAGVLGGVLISLQFSAIADKETAKDNVRLRAFELLGKIPEVGLFTAETKPDKPRTIEDIDKELRERLAEMATAGGASTIDGTARPADTPHAVDRRRKPKA